MHKHAWFCPHCFDLEYGTAISSGSAWKKWVNALYVAGFEVGAHLNLGEHLAARSDTSVFRSSKIALLVEYYAIERGQSADEILDLVG
jgi:hypothetical protein